MIGQQIQDRYRILTELGRGGMGEVYLAEHMHLKRLEAVKVLRPNLADEFAGRFRREARAMNRLRHPNIVCVYDFGQLPDGRFYLSMEFAQGSNLRDVLRKVGVLGVDRTVAILSQMAEAIDHAHSRGVIHRDLKPANLILGKDKSDADLVKILDFGVAKIIAPEYIDSLPKTGRVFYGTPAYMSPELLKGTGDDPRSDIYSLGCIGFELLTGRRLYSGAPVEVCQKQIASPAPRLGDAAAGPFPPELESVISRCLEKSPARRPQTGAEIVQQLSRFRVNPSRGAQIATMRFPSLRGIGDLYEESSTAVSVTAKEAERNEPDHGRLELQLALKRLAELIADLGCSDPKLVLAITEVDRADAKVAVHRDAIDDLRRERERVDQSLRENEASLRFSLGELDHARRSGSRSATQDGELAAAVEALEAEFRETAAAGAEHHRAIDEREIALVARQSDLEELRDAAYTKLDRILGPLVPSFQGEASVALIATQLAVLKSDTDQTTGLIVEPDTDSAL